MVENYVPIYEWLAENTHRLRYTAERYIHVSAKRGKISLITRRASLLLRLLETEVVETDIRQNYVWCETVSELRRIVVELNAFLDCLEPTDMGFHKVFEHLREYKEMGELSQKNRDRNEQEIMDRLLPHAQVS